MKDEITNGCTVRVKSAAFVLNGIPPDDVARAMINGGQQKEPFYIFDMDEASRCIQQLKDLLPRVETFYAMKANDYEMTLKLAVAHGLGFDCASPGEINKVKKLKVCPRSIVYAVPIKTQDQLMFAKASGVQHTTVDSSFEMKKLKQFWPEAKLLLRVRVESICTYQLGDKFGCDFDTEAIGLLDEAASLGLKVIGVAFHVGSPCWTPESYETGLQYARALFDHEAKAGRQMKIVDIGGGFGGDKPELLNTTAKIINSALEKLFPDPEVQVISEVGRYICESAFKLYCSICSVGKVSKNNKHLNTLYLNDGYFGTQRIYEKWHSVEKFRASNDTDSSPLEETILWGPSCDSVDRVRENQNVRLPRCYPNDWLVFDYQGAYTFCFKSEFSCLGSPQIRSVISSSLWNKIKDSKVFSPSDFVLDPDISTPLPSSTPLNIKTDGYEYSQMPKLVV